MWQKQMTTVATERGERMDVECTLNSYKKDGIGTLLLKVSNVAFDGHKVNLTVVSQGGTKHTCIDVVGDELISAVQKCMLNWRGL